jgi:O-acetyl-ADP-ribose deacetylase (regulator of RNase III)
MITLVRGDLLSDDAEAIINTVNTEGVMGKGIALQFKKRFPANFQAYRAACKRREVQLGSMFVVPTGSLSGPRYIINFPTKGHWRTKSSLADVQSGLADLVRVIKELHIRSIAIPPLGCGNGGLQWSEVRPVILNALGDVSDLEVRLYEPAGAPAPKTMVVATPKPNMTLARAVVTRLIERYSGSERGVRRLEVQKLVYFSQVAGVPLRLQYVRGQFGPYAENLNHVLKSIDGHFVLGFGDGSAASELTANRSNVAEVDAFLLEYPEVSAQIERVLELVDGFESPYGLELLGSVHFVASEGSAADRIAEDVRAWSDRKGRLFTDHHLSVAQNHLRELGWIGDPTNAAAVA